ncbi:MAG: CHAT domain-containing protein [Nitrospirales bacterium]|nr:CHAT domain-containing protein [Nitrospirales bacterium]
MSIIVCVPKSLTPSQSEVANRRGIEINPANAAVSRTIVRTPVGRRGGLRRLALLVGNRWPASGVNLTVQFLDNPSNELRARILLHMNAWRKTANIRFEETHGTGMVRIARLDRPPEMAGYWSYVGTQILGIEDDQPTFNLEGFTMRTSEAEFRRVVRHEAGHTMGFEHEHMRSELVKKIDPQKAIAYFDRTLGWTKEETKEQVLTPLKKASIMGTDESDPLSIMCYQIPGNITKDGRPIQGGRDINSKDFLFAGKVYPKPSAQSPAPAPEPQAGPQGVAVGSASLQDVDTLHIVIMDEFNPGREAVRQKSDHTEAQTDAQRPRFARVFASYGGARVTNAMRLRAGKAEEPTSYGKIIRMHERIKNYTNRERGSLPSDDEMVKFGSDLFKTLFEGDVGRLYDEARARQQNRKLDIVLTSMIPWIAEKPWEFAYDAARQSFLATEEVHLVRNVLTAIPAYAAAQRCGPLRILVAASQPVGFGHLSVDQEVEVIRRGFMPLIDAGLVTVEVLARTTPADILRYISTGEFTVVHIIGHGSFDDRKEEGSLFFEDEGGGQVPLGKRSVREIFCKRGISLVFLNACQSGSGGRDDFNEGLAQSLVSHGLPAVVANQYSVLDSSATSFAQHFYWCLAHGMSIGQAACEARIGVNCSMQGELIDWAVPVVYARDPNMALCVKPDRIQVSSTGVRAATRRAIQGRSVRVAVWDIDNVFPSIDHTLESMNDMQSVFGFELVTLSAPIDAWDLEKRTEEGTPYLWAEKLARRLGRMPIELRVNILACITRHWLRDDDWLNLYGWWPVNKKPPVVIFSCAGFDELAPEGPETDRVIANISVTMLAGFLGQMDSHKRGAKDCPLAFDEGRDLELLAGPQVFDQNCHAKLKKKIPTELAALKVLLKTFN